MKKILIALVVAFTGHLLMATDCEGCQNAWSTDFTNSLAYAKANDLPIVVVWGNTSCAYCIKLTAVLDNETIIEWAEANSAVLVLKHENHGSMDTDYVAAREWVKSINSSISGYPFVGVYWKTNNTIACSGAFTGREGMMPVEADGLVGEFSTLLEDALAENAQQYELQSALDNYDFNFAIEGDDAYWEIIEDSTAKGGTCLKLGPLDSGESVSVVTECEGRGALLYNLRSPQKWGSCKWCDGSTEFTVWMDDSGSGMWPSVEWREGCFAKNSEDSSELRLELYLDDGWDGQSCFIDNIRWVTLNDILGVGLDFSIDDDWSVSADSSSGAFVECDYLEGLSKQNISLCVSGAGTIRFKSRGSLWNDGYEFGVSVDDDVVWSKSCDGNYLNWSKQTVYVPVLGNGEHEIVWYAKNSSSFKSYGDVGVSNVEWIPAPSHLDVSFNSEGGLIDGAEKTTSSFATGECYGSLPTPVREDRTFVGWFTSEGVKVTSSDYVILMATNLYARWNIKLDGVYDIQKSREGIACDKNGVVFPMPVNAQENETFFQVSCEGEAIVSFDWVLEAAGQLLDDDYYSKRVCRAFFVDGEPINTKECECSECKWDSNEDGYGYSHIYRDDWWGDEDEPLYKTVSQNRSTVRVFLTPGEHVLKWDVSYMDEGVRFAVENFKVEKQTQQESIEDLAKLLYDTRTLKPGNLAYLYDSVYGARIAADPNDHEAKIIRAALKLAMLVENAEIRDFVQKCGYVIADYTMRVSGKFCGLDHLAPANETIDRLSPEVLAAIDDALADLNLIPENWNGALELSPKKYEILRESVYVDMAEISMLKAVLESVRASVLLVKGYDFSMDYVTVSNVFETAEYVGDVLDAAPQAGYVRDVSALLESKTWFKKGLQHIRRADQIILWRSNPLPHFFEYDLVDADNLARARLYLEQLIGSLDHPETIDLPYFVDKFDYQGETLPMGMFRQFYLGAIFAGHVTKDLVPEVKIDREQKNGNPSTLYMDTIEDTTLGGLLPDLGFEEFATLFPFNQYWSLSLYDEYRPQSLLCRDQTLTVAGEALCDGTLDYLVNLEKLNYFTAQCIVDGLVVDSICLKSTMGTKESRSVALQEGSEYRLVFAMVHHGMKARQQIFEITSVPEVSPVADGSYSQTINGVTWNFTVSDDEATVTGATGAVGGDVVVPDKLGGRTVVAIGDKAFMEESLSTITLPSEVRCIGKGAFLWCENLTKITFRGKEPTVGELAFNGLEATVVFNGGTELTNLSEGKWCGMTVQYASDSTNEGLRVRASLPDGYEFNGMATLSLSVSGDATIYFTMNGAEPTTNALVYSSPISVSITTRIKYFAVDNQNGDTGPVGTLLLKLVTPDSALLSNSEYSKTVNGIGWTYQEYANGVRLIGNSGTAAGDKVTGAIVIPDAINWQPVTVIGEGLFESCEGIASIKIPSTVTDIERDAFKGCTRLQSITLPEGLRSIADGAFERCTSLTNIVIPATVTNIGYFAFRDCLRLVDVVLKGDPPRHDLGVYMGVPAFTVISGRLGSATAIIYAGITNKTDEITVPESWLDEIAAMHNKPAGADSYQAAFKAKYGDDLKIALTKPTGKNDLKGNPLYVWQDYVAGTDPLDEEDKFTATITMEGGIPIVRWSPELPDAAAATRKYTVYGATALNGMWDDVTDKTDQQRRDLGYQFFSVTVEMK